MNNEKEFERKIEILLAALMAIENNTRGKLVSLAQANWYLENVNTNVSYMAQCQL